MSSSQNKALNDFANLRNRGVMFHAVRAAGELGILKVLATGQRTAQQLADELKLDLQALYRLLDVLTQTEVIERYQEDYALSPMGQLIPPAFQDFGDGYLRQLADHVRSGTPLSDDRFAKEQSSIEWTLTPTALDVAQALDIGKTRRGLRVLEVACGSAVFGVTIAHRDPNSRVCLMDSSEPLERARTTAENVGIANQINWLEADPLNDLKELENEAPFDLIVFCNLLHQIDVDQSKPLMSRLYEHLKPEGELAVVDVFPGQEAGQLNRFVFELELNLRSTGKLRDPREIRTEMEEIGYRQIQYAQLPAEPHIYGLILATK